MIEILTFFYHSDLMEHPKMLMTTWFDSIMQKSNIPELMKTEKVIHNLYVTPQDVPYLEKNYVPMAKKVGLDVFFYPMIKDRENLYEAIMDQFKKSIQNDSVVITAPADSVFGNGMAKLAKNLKKGELLVCPTLRIKNSSFEIVKTFLEKKHNNKDFSRLFIDEVPHKLLQLAKEKYWDYERLEKTKDGWNFFMKEPAPLMCYASEDMFEAYEKPWSGLFEVIDHDLPDLMFRKGKLKWVEKNTEFVWGEFTYDDKYDTMIDNKYYSEAAKFFMNLPIQEKI